MLSWPFYLLYGVLFFNLIAIFVLVFVEKAEPSVIAAWVGLFTLLPALGFLLYLFFGSTLQVKFMSRRYRLRDIEEQYAEVLSEQIDEITRREIIFNDPDIEPYRDIVVMNARHGGAIYTQDNTAELLLGGQENFSRMFADIEAATESVDVIYFIFKPRDKIGREFLALLARKAREGVRVRLCYDMLGYVKGRHGDYKILTDAGGQVYSYMPSRWRTFFLANYRMHRKIVIIDDKIAYTGGINVGDEYLGSHPKKTPWRDTGVRIRGTAVWLLKLRFLSDWTFVDQQHKRSLRAGRGELVREFKNRLGARQRTSLAKGEGPSPKKGPAYPEPATLPASQPALAELFFSHSGQAADFAPVNMGEGPGRVGVQIVSSGPDSDYQYMRDCYMKMATSARRYLYIQSPYFIPGESLYNAIAQAAASGVDVRLMLPKIPDFPLLQAASISYARDLQRLGARVYIYDGFLHAKSWVIDDAVSSVGTTNVNLRSFMLNYETNGVFYDTDFARRCREVFEADLDCCLPLEPSTYGFITRAFQTICRLGGPLM